MGKAYRFYIEYDCFARRKDIASLFVYAIASGREGFYKGTKGGVKLCLIVKLLVDVTLATVVVVFLVPVLLAAVILAGLVAVVVVVSLLVSGVSNSVKLMIWFCPATVLVVPAIVAVKAITTVMMTKNLSYIGRGMQV
jgi:ABC-type multidrug transport system permease subunit